MVGNCCTVHVSILCGILLTAIVLVVVVGCGLVLLYTLCMLNHHNQDILQSNIHFSSSLLPLSTKSVRNCGVEFAVDSFQNALSL